MAPKSKLAATKAKAAQNAVKEKVFHPQSRKAGQMERASLRKGKLAGQSHRRSKKQLEKADRFAFFLHALPPHVPALALPEFHELITDLWLTRNDEALRNEESIRRKGRPPSAKELALKEQKLQDETEYRSGLELPDLTHPPTVELFRKWENSDPAYLHLLRFVRISSATPFSVSVVKYGLQEAASAKPTTIGKDGDDNMVEDEEEEVMEVDAMVGETSIDSVGPGLLSDVPLTRTIVTL